MRTSLTFRNLFKSITYCILFLGLSLSLNAQCPTVVNPISQICDAAELTFQDLNIYATDINNDIVWYDAPTDGNSFNANELVSEGTYFAGNSSGNCGTRDSVTIDFIIDNSGQNLDAIYCSNETPTIQLYIDEVLSFATPIGGSVEIYRDFELTNQATPTDIIPSGGVNYFIVFVDGSGCRSQIEIGTAATFDAPEDPTPMLVQSFCTTTNSTVADLDAGTTEGFNWFENLDGSGNPVQPFLNDTDIITSGTYYVQVISFFSVQVIR